MRTVSIDATAIGRKTPIDVQVETGKVRASITVMKQIAAVEMAAEKMSQAPEAEQDTYVIDYLDSMDKMLSGINDFIGDVLGLTKKQREDLDKCDPQAVQTLAQDIAGALMGIRNTAPTEDDQKSNGQ